jgi:hypothetical protein
MEDILVLRWTHFDERNLSPSHADERTPQESVSLVIIHHELVVDPPGFVEVNKLSIIKAVLVPVIHSVCVFNRITRTLFDYDDFHRPIVRDLLNP